MTYINNALSHALHYINKGWFILPIHNISMDATTRCSCARDNCPTPGNHPVITSGIDGATTDINITIFWWGWEYPAANIGLVPGKKSGIFVLNIEGEVGDEGWSRLGKNHGKLPRTREQKTPIGDKQLFFKYPKNKIIPNRVEIVPGINVISDGEFVLLPPSGHRSGKQYEWSKNYVVTSAPGWLLDRIEQKFK